MNSKISLEDMGHALRKLDNICFIAHKSPDGDTLGSCFAIKYALDKLSKKIFVICSDKIPQRLSFLGELDSLDKTNNNTTFIGIDLADVNLLGDTLYCLKDKIEFCIDHHMSNTMYAKRSLIEKDAAATAEIIYRMILNMNVPIDEKIASCIYTAIATDTGCFKYPNTTQSTHIIAAKMIEHGCDVQTINKLMFDTKSKTQIKLETEVLKSLEFYFDGLCALIEVTSKTKDLCGAADEDLEQLSSIPKQIENVLVGVTLKEKETGEIKISVRTDGAVNASKICSVFGGGGHKAAAGCALNSSIKDAKTKILNEIEKVLKEKINNERNLVN